MAKPASGENKAPLVIALVFFVLCTIGLGVFTYTNADDLANAKKAADDAAKDKKSAGETAEKARDEALIYKAALGVLTEKDRETLQGIRFKTEAQAAHRAMIDAINAQSAKAIQDQVKNFGIGGAPFSASPTDVFVWQWPADGSVPQPPGKSVIDNAVNSMALRELNERNYKAMEASYKTSTQLMVTTTNARDSAVKEFKDRTAAIPGTIASEVEKNRKGYEAKANDFVAQQQAAREKVDDASNKLAEKELQVKKAVERIAIQDRKIDELLSKELDLIDPFQFDKPQGKILRRYSDSLVDIDLGTTDKLRAGIAFSIFPSDTLVRGMQPRMRPFKDVDGRIAYKPIPKGKVEVIEVLGPSIATCRIVDEDNAVRDRIIPGDLLYNALWHKGVSEHVALFGIFDLDGDGRDDTQELIAGLRRVGVVVDAYYDLGKMKWVGEITSQTNFGVEGFYPNVSAGDGNRDAKIKILNAIGDARKAIKEKGLLILKPRDFFPRIGFNAKIDVSEDAINQAATGFTRAQYDKPEGAAPGDPAKPADPKN